MYCDKVQKELEVADIPFIANGPALACDNRDAIVVLLKYPDMIEKTDFDSIFVDRWISLIESCDVHRANKKKIL
jgi:hypothetical protein